MTDTLKDKHGTTVEIGDMIRVLSLPDIEYSEQDLAELNTFIGDNFAVESIEYGCAEVSRRFGAGEEKRWHTLFLWPDEFEKV